MSTLTEEQKAQLNRLAERVNANPTQLRGDAMVADMFRKRLPDLDDVTIGLVILEVCLVGKNVDLFEQNLRDFIISMTRTALELTALERGER